MDNDVVTLISKDGKEQKKQLHIQVYGMDSGKYELNMYIEEVELDEIDKIKDFIVKFKQKMGKTTHQTMTDWVDGIGELSSGEKRALKKKLEPFTEEMVDEKKLIGAICAAPIILEENGLLEKRKRTSHPSVKESLLGDFYVEDRVAVDHNIITSRSPGTAMEFAFKLVEILFGKDRVILVNEGVLANI